MPAYPAAIPHQLSFNLLVLSCGLSATPLLMLILVNQLEQSSDAETPLIKRPVYPAFNLGRFRFEIILSP